jgi:hypothetical protein
MRSTAQGGGNIVATDLVLYLDAMNPISYDGSTIWKDLTGNHNDFTLNNSPTYNGQSLLFNSNGGNQYAECINSKFGNFGVSSFTLEYVYNYVTGSGVFTAIMAKRISMGAPNATNRPGFSVNPENTILVTDSTGLLNNIDAYIDYKPKIIKNIITHQTLVVDRNNIDTNIITASLYSNTVVFSDNIQCRMTGSGNIDNNLNCRLFRSYDGPYATGSLSIIRAYNKALTPDEITQNYNATKDRFGI